MVHTTPYKPLEVFLFFAGDLKKKNDETAEQLGAHWSLLRAFASL